MPSPFAWDISKPAGSDSLSQGDDQIRTDKTTLRAVLRTLEPYGTASAGWRNVQVDDDNYLVQNASWSGSVWQKDNTSLPATAFRYKSTGEVEVLWRATGTGTWAHATWIVVTRFSSVSAGVNFPELLAAATGTAVEVKATGTDTDIDVVLRPKGAGKPKAIVTAGTIDLLPTGFRGSRGQASSPNASIPASRYDLAADAVMLADSTNSIVIRNSPATVTCDTEVAGPAANGRDQSGAFAATTWLHFYWIWNGTTLASTVSTTAPPTGPALPGGYTHWAYAGAVYRLTSSLVYTWIFGDIAHTGSVRQILASGSATTETTVPITAAVPPNAKWFQMLARVQQGIQSAQDVHLRITSGADYAALPVPGVSTGTSPPYVTALNFPNRTPIYLWDASGGNLSLFVNSYALPNGG